MSEIYDVDYFIKKFEAIPESEIGSCNLQNHCALWHMGVRFYANDEITEEVKALANLFAPFAEPIDEHERLRAFPHVYIVADGTRGNDRFGNSPKARLLNALKEVKEGAVK